MVVRNMMENIINFIKIVEKSVIDNNKSFINNSFDNDTNASDQIISINLLS